MAKGYWIANNDISDLSGMAGYRNANREVMTRYGAKFIAVGGAQTIVEGPARSRVTAVEYPSYEAALACYNDPDYQAAATLRHAIAEGMMIIVEGYDGPQDI